MLVKTVRYMFVAIVAGSVYSWPTARRESGSALSANPDSWLSALLPSLHHRRQAAESQPVSCGEKCDPPYTGPLRKGGLRATVRQMQPDGIDKVVRFPGNPALKGKGVYRDLGFAYSGPASSYVAVMEDSNIPNVFISRVVGVQDVKADGAVTPGTVCVDLGEDHVIQVRSDTSAGFDADTEFKLWVIQSRIWQDPEAQDPCVPSYSAKLRNRANERVVVYAREGVDGGRD